MLGRHCINPWSKTQSMIAKSLGESELYGVIKGSSEALGLVTLAKDLGMEINTRVHVDATAAKGMVERRGISRVQWITCGSRSRKLGGCSKSARLNGEKFRRI